MTNPRRPDTTHESGSLLYGATVIGHCVEGANYASDWWRWEQRPGRIAGAATSQTAADHWNRYRDDFKLASKLGLNCLLISIEWARIEPKQGEFDREALDHYARVLESLNKVGITPIVALQAITLPAWFADAGGWARDDAADCFAGYVEEAARSLSASCRHWIPLYRVYDAVEMGALQCSWPPGKKRGLSLARIQKNTTFAIVRASDILRGMDTDARLGCSYNAADALPYDPESPWDFRAARAINMFDSCGPCADPDDPLAWGDPLFPWVAPRFALGDAIDQASSARLENPPEIVQDFHFVAITMPGRRWMRFSPAAIRRGFVQPVDEEGAPVDFRYRQPDVSRLSIVHKRALGDSLPVLFIGGAHDFAADRTRCAYILDHFEAIQHCRDNGLDVMGYVHESFLDGFEWDRGYSTRRGLVHVDWETLARTPNQSAYLLGSIARQGGITPGAVRKHCPGWESKREAVR